MDSLIDIIKQHQPFHKVVPFDEKKDKLLRFNLTASNTTLTDDVLNNTEHFTEYINVTLAKANATYGIGGYAEHRTIYKRSELFDGEEEPRRFHLGIDIWGAVGTPVYAPMDAVVHSFAFNDAFGDYGATLVLRHELEGKTFHTLYGHLSLASIQDKKHDQVISKGERIASFGVPKENGYWPPHLHFQMIIEKKTRKGDYRGVCRYSEREHYLNNCPDPDLILDMMKYAKEQ